MLKRKVYELKQQTEKGAFNSTYGNNNNRINKNTGELDFSHIHGDGGMELEHKTSETNMNVVHGKRLELKTGKNDMGAGKTESESKAETHTMHDGHQHGGHGETMNRGLSALFTNDDMALGPERNRQLSPIPQHP